MRYEIKPYKDLIKVTISDFSGNVKILHYEGTQAQFFNKVNSNDFIYFPIHKKTVKSSMVIDVEDVDSAEKSFSELIYSLSEEDRKAVKGHIKIYKSNFWKDPSLTNIKNFLKEHEKEKEKNKILQEGIKKIKEEENRKLTDLEKFYTKIKGNKYKIARIVTGNILWFSENKKVLWTYI